MPKLLWSIAALCNILSAPAVANQLTNGGFDTDLSGWNWSGVVAQVSGEARVGDDGAGSGYSLLYQPVTGAGFYSLDLDFFNGLSSDGSGGAGPLDSFYATLYLTNDLGALDIPLGIYDDFLALFEMDANGVFNLIGGATLGPSPKGGGWQHFSLSFQSAYDNLVPAFELLDQNFVDDDSSVYLDNVILSAVVPAPGPLTLMAAVLLLPWRGRWGPWRPGHRP
jgi:hypothetical protein